VAGAHGRDAARDGAADRECRDEGSICAGLALVSMAAVQERRASDRRRSASFAQSVVRHCSHLLKIIAAIFLFAAGVLASSCAREPAFTPPPAERIAALLEFGGPVALVRHIASAEDLSRAPKRKGVPLASFSYSDPAHSSDTITVTVYPAGAFLGAKRAQFSDFAAKRSTKAEEGVPASGTFPATDGRSILQFPLGFGPGGGAYGALLPCHDSRYELVVVQSTNFHDDEDGKTYSHHVSPKKDLKSIIETIEKLVFP
jgi:hypothetical protein